MKISIVTVCYNSESTIRDTIESVLSQSYHEVQHIIIDGSSKDKTMAIVEEYKDRIDIFISEADEGIYDAMNKGIRLANGDIVGILNADDWYGSVNVLERVEKVFEDPTVEACYGDLVYVQGAGGCNPVRGMQRKSSMITGCQAQSLRTLRYWKAGHFVLNKFKWGWMPPHPTFFVRRQVYDKFGGFNLDLGSAADYELMLRFLLKYRVNVAYIPEVLVCMRAGGVSNASIKNRLKANRMDRKAWDVNELKPYPWTLPLKPIRKIPQYWMRPINW